MLTLSDIQKKLKDSSEDRLLVIEIDGEFYDVEIQTICVKKGKNWANEDCYHQVDEGTEGSFNVYAII